MNPLACRNSRPLVTVVVRCSPFECGPDVAQPAMWNDPSCAPSALRCRRLGPSRRREPTRYEGGHGAKKGYSPCCEESTC
jgi:hypothetical protein